MIAKLRKLIRLSPELFVPAMKAAVEAYPPHNSYGVLGLSIQPKRVLGRARSTWTLAAFIRRKELEPSNPVRAVRFEHNGQLFEVKPDVVAMGRETVAASGHEANYSGLHAGAAIRIGTGSACVGGVACLLGKGAGPTHLLTAGHLFPVGATNAAVLAAIAPGAAPQVVGRLELNLLERSSAAADIALVKLTTEGRQLAQSSGTASTLPRLLPDPFDAGSIGGVGLRVWLPLRGEFEGDLSGVFQLNSFTVSSGCRAAHRVENVILTGFAQNTEGNSGTVLMSDDHSGTCLGQAVGVAIGFAGSQSLHEPIDRALGNIAQDTGDQFEIWSVA